MNLKEMDLVFGPSKTMVMLFTGRNRCMYVDHDLPIDDTIEHNNILLTTQKESTNVEKYQR